MRTTEQNQENGINELILKELRQHGRDLEEIKLSISGSTKLGIKGLVKRMDSQESDIDSLKSWRSNINLKVAYTSGVVSGITFGALEGIKAIIESITHHP